MAQEGRVRRTAEGNPRLERRLFDWEEPYSIAMLLLNELPVSEGWIIRIAAVAGMRLLTRYPRRYPTYFPTVDLIVAPLFLLHNGRTCHNNYCSTIFSKI